MKQFIILVMLLSGFYAFSQGNQKSAAELKQEMAQIRRSTNWGNEAEAKKADEKIQALAKQLMLMNQLQNQQKAGNTDTAQTREDVDYKMKLWGQMMKSVEQGKGSDILLAEPLRDEIIEENKEDESPKNIRAEYLQEMTVLVIDMSIATVQRTIDVMQNYKSIKTLVITGGEFGAPVNLPDLLTRASNFPLQNLYIINFRHFLTSIPEQINQFGNLSTLAVYNNKISQLPVISGFSSKLDSLFIDINPVATLFPAINSMHNLKRLGIAKTSISEAEITEIRQILPECQILTK